MYCARKLLLVVFIFHFAQTLTQAQTGVEGGYPKIGEPCPDFVLKDIVDYPESEISLNDFPDKWLILYFWTARCSSCIKSFPKINQLQSKFKNRVQFIMVGRDDKYIRPLYKKLMDRYSLNLTIAYDTTLFRQFGIVGVPHIVVIDDKGVVKAITYSITKEDVEKFLSNSENSLPVKQNSEELQNEQQFNEHKPLLIDDNGGNDTSFLYRSILTKWNRKMGQVAYDHIHSDIIRNNTLQVFGVSLDWLYQLAYGDTVSTSPDWQGLPSTYGKLLRRPLLEIRDSTDFDYDFLSGRGVYAYSLILKNRKQLTVKDFQRIIQNDLENYFNYEAKVEIRNMPYWKLVATNEARRQLKTKGEEPKEEYRQDGIVLQNMPIHRLICVLWYGDQFGPPFIDETKIDGNIDIDLKAIITDFDSVIDSLRKNGLDLVKGEKKVKVVVIKNK